MDLHSRLATSADAPAMQELVRACYGATYPELRDGAQGLAGRLAGGTAGYAIATDLAGGIVGQVALERRGPGLWEHGRAVVAPAHRSRGLLATLSRHLFEDFAPRHGVRFVFGRSVTNHLRTQRYNLAAGFSPLGLLLGVWEPALRVAGVPAATQPISALLVGLWLDPIRRPRRLALRGGDLERAEAVLGSFGVESERVAPRRRRGPLRARREDGQGGRLVHLRLTDDPAAPTLDDRDLLERPGVSWADVPAEARDAAARLEALRAHGFTWGAYLPHGGALGEDVVRLQRYDDPRPLLLEEIQVVEPARALRDAVHAEALEAALVGAP